MSPRPKHVSPEFIDALEHAEASKELVSSLRKDIMPKQRYRIPNYVINVLLCCVVGLALSAFFTVASVFTVAATLLLSLTTYMLGQIFGFERGKGFGEATANIKWMCVVRPIVDKRCKRINVDGTVSIGTAYCHMCFRSGIPGEDNFHAGDCAYKRLTRDGLK
jgi:hypothetical protein